MRYIFAVCAIVIAVLREVGGAVVHYGAVHRWPTGVNVMGVVVVLGVVAALLDAPVAVASVTPVGPFFPVLAIAGVVWANYVSPRLGLQLLTALARVVPIDLLQLVGLYHIQLGLLLHVGGPQVLLGVVVPSEGPALAHEAGPAQDQQEDQEQDPAHRPAHNGAQAAVSQGGQGRGGEQGSALIGARAGAQGLLEERGRGGGSSRGGGRVWRVDTEQRSREGGCG